LDNLFRGGAGADSLDGGAGSDTVDYADKTMSVVLTLNGATNATAMVGGVADDTLHNIENMIGRAGADTLVGDGAINSISGLGGADLLRGGAGADAIDGGAGVDTVYYSDKAAAVVVTLNGATNATATVGGVAEDTLRNIEKVVGGTAGDTLFGDAGVNALSGIAGDDVLRGSGGADILDGGAGADTVDGGAGSDNGGLQRQDGVGGRDAERRRQRHGDGRRRRGRQDPET
jgi:Ca2+-binding RTX toxin-like protein